MKILVLNSGSSSIKFRLFEMPQCETLAWGLVERIGDSHAQVHLSLPSHRFPEECMIERRVGDHREGMELLLQMLIDSEVIASHACIEGVGHRVVHGGERFQAPVKIDDRVVEAIEALCVLAPLHNPANLEGITIARQKIPHVPQVAVFDTAFHQTLPEQAFLYALPRKLYEAEGVRRYGFHGTSHHYVAKMAAEYLGTPLEEMNLITLHLGNGASACAVKAGKSVDTSMGMTPLEGLVMGTRCGDMDPEILLYLIRDKGMDPAVLDTLVNKESGLKGLCGSNDMREIVERMKAGDGAARTAFEVFVYRIRKYIGSYAAVLGRIDALVFTGGIGEHAVPVRSAVCEGLEELFGIRVDNARNEACSGDVCPIHCDGAGIPVLVVPTNEELEIAVQTRQVIEEAGA